MPKKVASADEVLQMLKDRDREQYPVVSAGQVADLMGFSRPVATERLEKLEERGVLERTKVGRARAWWVKGERMVDSGTDTRIESTDGQSEQSTSDITNPDGGATRLDTPTPIRERGLEVIDRFEQDLARMTAEALTAARIGVWRFLKLFVVTALFALLGFAGIMYHTLFNSVSETFLLLASGSFFCGMVGLFVVVVAFFARFRQEYTAAKQEIALQIITDN